jgi:outer membrane lipoprotein-sorting protein
MARKLLRWLPAITVPAVIAAGALVMPLTANAASDLPHKSSQEVLELVAQSTVTALSGTVEQTSKLGLPQLPSTGSSGGPSRAPGGSGSSSALDPASILELLTGTHTARVDLNGPDKQHVAVLDKLAERDVIRNGSDVWLWDYSKQTATHVTLPAHKAAETDAPTDAMTPAQLAKKLLASVDPTTHVSVGADTKVAGRDAYTLDIQPRSNTTLVSSISIAVDAKTGLPLSVLVTARGQKQPAFELAFTKLSLEKPSDSAFTFTPPKGAKVTEQALSAPSTMSEPKGEVQQGAESRGEVPNGEVKDSARPRPSVIGTGWDAIVALPAGSVPADLTASPLFSQLTESVSGGRLLSTSLLNVLITDDGRVFAGAVPRQALTDASARQ